jgi:hypothetical protein
MDNIAMPQRPGARRHTLPEGVASKLARSKRQQSAAVQKDVKIYGTNSLMSFSINKRVEKTNSN